MTMMMTARIQWGSDDDEGDEENDGTDSGKRNINQDPSSLASAKARATGGGSRREQGAHKTGSAGIPNPISAGHRLNA